MTGASIPLAPDSVAALAAWAAGFLDEAVVFTHEGTLHKVDGDGKVEPALVLRHDLTLGVPGFDDNILFDRVHDKLSERGTDYFEEKRIIGAKFEWSFRIGTIAVERGYPLYGGIGHTRVEALLKAARAAVEGSPTSAVTVRWTDGDALKEQTRKAFMDACPARYLDYTAVWETYVGEVLDKVFPPA